MKTKALRILLWVILAAVLHCSSPWAQNSGQGEGAAVTKHGSEAYEAASAALGITIKGPGVYPLSGDKTIASDYQGMCGVVFDPNGHKLRFSKSFTAPRCRQFTSAVEGLTSVYPEWFYSGSGYWESAINAAARSMPTPMETLTLDRAPAPAAWAAGAILSGATSKATCEVVARLADTTYSVRFRDNTFAPGEVITDGKNRVSPGAAYPVFTPGWTGVSGGEPTAYGGTILLDSSKIYLTAGKIIMRPYVSLVSDGYRGAIIRMTSSSAEPVIFAPDARWARFEGITAETANRGLPGQHGIHFRRSTTLGNKFIIDRVSFNHTYNAIEIDGDATGIRITDVYSRNATNDVIHATAAGSLSTPYIKGIYASNMGGYALHVEGGIGNGEVSLIAEGNRGVRLNNASRVTFPSLYLGDQIQEYPLVLINSFGNEFGTVFIDGKGTNSTSAILLDGSYGNSIRKLITMGGIGRYLVEWANTASVPAKYLRTNSIGMTFTTSGPTLGKTNDPTYISFDGIQSVFQDLDHASAGSPVYQHEVKGETVSIATPDVPASVIDKTDQMPQAGARATLASHFPGAPNYSLLFHSGTSFAGVLPSPEQLGPSLVTGESSTFTTTKGDWKGVGAFLSVASGQMKIVNSGRAAGYAKLRITGLQTGGLYKMKVDGAFVSSMGYITIYGSNESTLLKAAQPLSQKDRKSTYTVYWEATADTAWIFLSNVSTAAGAYQLVDNITVQKVLSAGSMTLSGGRTFGNGSGGGGNISMYGVDHAGRSGKIYVGGIAEASETPMVLQERGSWKPVTIGPPDSGGPGFRCLRVPN